jgi:hypothetical protein
MRFFNLIYRPGTRLAVLFCLLLSIGWLAAQDIQPWQYVRHSARDNNGMVHVRFNGTPSILGEYELTAYQNSAWIPQTLTTPEALTYEALLPYTYGQNLKYRLKTSYTVAGQTITAMNPAFLDSDTFPPALTNLGFIADDPVGDSISAYFSNLDLTGNWFGFTDNKLFTTMSDAANAFPTMNSLTSYNIYFAGLANTATALTDSSVYVMLYTFNLGTVISPGLYKFNFNMADTSFVYTRLGNIQSQVVNGKLNLACNIADLAADASFGTWPPANNSLGFMAGSIRMAMDLSTMTPSFTIGDFSGIAQLIFENNHYQVAQNTLPVITDPDPGDVYVSFSYSDAEGDFPLTAKFTLDSQQEFDFTPTSLDFSQPVQMTVLNPMGWASAWIEVSDNNISSAIYIFGDANEDETLPLAPAVKIYPNPFNPASGLLYVELSGAKNQTGSGAIYNLRGQLVKKLASHPTATSSVLNWDGLDADNYPVAAGIYFMRLKQEDKSLSRKIIVIR